LAIGPAFRRYWRWKSWSTGRADRRSRQNCAAADPADEHREFCFWGCAAHPRPKLLKLGFLASLNQVSPSIWSSDAGPPSQEWADLSAKTTRPDIAAMDLFVVPTIGFKAAVWLRHHSGLIAEISSGSASQPTRRRSGFARQITEAFSLGMALRAYMIPRSRSKIYGTVITRPTACHGYPRQANCNRPSPWQKLLCRTADRIDPARVFGPTSLSWTEETSASDSEKSYADYYKRREKRIGH